MLPWQFFANSLTESSNSLIDNSNLLTKVYFPRMIIPAGSVIVSLVDFIISIVMLFVMMVSYHIGPGIRMLMLPCFLFLVLLTAFGAGLWLSALNVKYRDFRYVVPFMVQFGLYISPVGFSSDIVPLSWRSFYYLNPMAGVIDGFRWAIIGNSFPAYWPGILLSALVTTLIFMGGLYYFRNMERSFADIV
jgi:lipopolysaccharide transport system permease protein